MNCRIKDDAFPAAGAALAASPPLDLRAFAKHYGGVTSAPLKAGMLLYSQGEPADALFYIKEGRVQVTVLSSQGKAGILGVLGRGEVCGEGCLLGNRRRVATAMCIADGQIARLERANVVRAIREDAAIAEFFIVFALSSVVRLRENLISQLFDSSEQRLARVLLALADRGGGSENAIRNVDQEALAQMIGTTRSRVNQFMNKFRNLRCIDYDGSTIIVHGALSKFARSDNARDWVVRSSSTRS